MFFFFKVHVFLSIYLERRQCDSSKLLSNVGVCLTDMGRAEKVQKALIIVTERLWCQLQFGHFVCQGL